MTPHPVPPLAMRLRPGQWLALSWLAGFGYGLIAWGLVMHEVEASVAAVIGTVLASGSIVLIRRYPVVAFAAALSVFFLSPASSELGWVGLVPMGLASYRVAERCSVRVTVAVVLLSISGALATALPRWQHTGAVIPFALVFITTAVAGYAVGQRRRYARELLAHHAREAEALREQARHGVVDERLRIARDLHDVIAHSLSVITVQAGYGHLVVDDQPTRARAALGTIEATGRQTLQEMRRLLGVLRSEPASAPEEHPSLAPAPGLADLDQLIAHTAQAGVRVALTITGTPRELPPAVDLSAYRIVQEAVTNVVRHAGVDVADARIDFGSDALVVEVSDHGNGCADGALTGPGHGLVGMRERAGLCDGVLTAGPLPHGGFRVSARLPIVEASV